MPKVFMYEDGTVTAVLFDAENVPKTGFSDNPKKAKNKSKSAVKKPVVKKRARKDGKFVADDPSTPNVNEAYE